MINDFVVIVERHGMVYDVSTTSSSLLSYHSCGNELLSSEVFCSEWCGTLQKEQVNALSRMPLQMCIDCHIVL